MTNESKTDFVPESSDLLKTAKEIYSGLKDLALKLDYDTKVFDNPRYEVEALEILTMRLLNERLDESLRNCATHDLRNR